jgi:DHA1 family inner membrane transport protein
MALTLALFAITNLVLGTGAFVVAGLLAPMAAELGVGIAAAGQAMTVYALAAAVIAPALVVFTGAWPRRRAVALALLLSVAGALVSGLAGSLPVLLIGRALTGAGIHFAALAAALAVALAPPERSARALSMVYLGVSLSFVLGLPAGTWLASFSSWRLPLLIIAAAATVLLGLLMLRLPASLHAPATGWRSLGALLRRADVRGALILTLLIGAAIFCTFSFIGPVLQALGPMSPAQVSATLATVGVAGLLGTVAGGVLADRLGVPGALRLLATVFLLSMVAVPFTAGAPALLMPVLAAWGAAGFGLMPVQQARLAALSPADAPVLIALNSAVLNIGTATGAMVGAAASGWIDLARLAWVGVPFMLVGLALLRR